MPVHSPLYTFDLPRLIEKVKHCLSSEKGDHGELVLLKSPEKQIVLTAFPSGTRISSARCEDSITFQVIEGKLDFRTREETITLEKGQLVALNENTKYSMITSEETILLLTIANGPWQPGLIKI